jgi:hypothetical protein
MIHRFCSRRRRGPSAARTLGHSDQGGFPDLRNTLDFISCSISFTCTDKLQCIPSFLNRGPYETVPSIAMLDEDL